MSSTLGLLATAALGLWVDFVYPRTTDASGAWDNLEELQSQIESGLFVANLRRYVSAFAVVSTMVWFVVVLVTRRRLALAVALVLGLSFAAWLAGSDWTSIQRSLFESGAAVVALIAVAAVYWLSTPSAQEPGSHVATP